MIDAGNAEEKKCKIRKKNTDIRDQKPKSPLTVSIPLVPVNVLCVVEGQRRGVRSRVWPSKAPNHRGGYCLAITPGYVLATSRDRLSSQKSFTPQYVSVVDLPVKK